MFGILFEAAVCLKIEGHEPLEFLFPHIAYT